MFDFIPFECKSSDRNARSYGNYISSVLRKLQSFCQFTLLPTVYKYFLFSTTSPTLVMSSLFYNSHTNGYEESEKVKLI